MRRLSLRNPPQPANVLLWVEAVSLLPGGWNIGNDPGDRFRVAGHHYLAFLRQDFLRFGPAEPDIPHGDYFHARCVTCFTGRSKVGGDGPRSFLGAPRDRMNGRSRLTGWNAALASAAGRQPI